MAHPQSMGSFPCPTPRVIRITDCPMWKVVLELGPQHFSSAFKVSRIAQKVGSI